MALTRAKELVNIGSAALASRPAAGQEGRIWLPSDGRPSLHRDTGSVWQSWGPLLGPFTDPPDLSAWTWENQGTATLSGKTIEVTASANSCGLYKAVPANPYVVTAAFIGSHMQLAQYIGGGLYLRQNDGKCTFFIAQYNGGWNLYIMTFSAFSTWVQTLSTTAFDGGLSAPVFLRIQDNSTNRIYFFSRDGVHFYQLYSHTRTTYITPTGIGMVAASGTNHANSITLLSWQEA